MKQRAIKFDNFKKYIGQKVDVSISSYHAGIMYPDGNTLIGMNIRTYYFKSEEGEFWHWDIDEENKNTGILVQSLSSNPKQDE